MGTFPSSDLISLSRRQRTTAFVLGALAIVAFVASSNRMSGMDMGGQFTAGSLGFFIVLWVMMMAAMMFPSVWPAVAMFGLVVQRQASSGASTVGRSIAFITGYLASWTLFGLAAFGLLTLARSVGLDNLNDTELARYVVAPVALAAALYQLVPIKQACLTQCRGPFSFFLTHWRDGWQGALAMGSRHGAFCVGCCWMLMVVLLALGVMSIAWMAVVSLAIAIEKLAPPKWSRLASGVLVAGLVMLALVALVKPSWLPGLNGTSQMEKMA